MKYFYLIKNFFLFPVLFIFFFLIFFEIFFFCFYSFSKLKYFENFRETKIRYNFNYDEIEKENYRKIKKDLGSKKIKVAIFGGSSARGYPFDTNFSDILQEVVGQNYIIHNFSKNGEPFVDFQSKKLLLLRKYYDYLIIYSGHNELWSYVYNNSKILKKNITFPNGISVDYKSFYLQRDIELYNIKKYILGKKIYDYREILTYFTNNLRSYNIFRKISVRFNKNFNFNKKIDNIKTYSIIENKPFINQKDKIKIVERFKDKISSIIKEKKVEQKIIIAPVLSNYFFSPFSDSILDLDLEKKLYIEKKIVYFYDNIASLKNLNNTFFLSDIEARAYKNNLKSIVCQNQKFEKCIKLAKLSNSFDTIPLRVLPKLNDFINNIDYNENDILYANIPKKINNEKNLEDFNKWFVDFQHPSIFGHIMISEILASIILKKNIKIENIHIGCNKFTFNIKKKNYVFKSNFKKALKDNINFLKSSNIYQPQLKYSYNYFINKALYQLKKCKFND